MESKLDKWRRRKNNHDAVMFCQPVGSPNGFPGANTCCRNHGADSSHSCATHHHSDSLHNCCGDKDSADGHHSHQHDKHWLKAAIGISFGVLMLILSLAGVAFPPAALFAITGISATLTIYLGFNIFKTSFNALRKKQLHHTMLYTISSITLITVSIVGLFVPGLLIVGETAALILGFWHLGEAIEHSLIDKLEDKLNILDCLPKKVIRSGESIPIEDLKIDDIIEIKPGEIIPVDGIIIEKAQLITTRFDGSAKRKWFGGEKNDANVTSGMEVPVNGQPITIRVQKTYANSHIYKEAQTIKSAVEEKSKVELLANKVLKYFAPIVLGTAILSGILIGIYFSPMMAVQCSVAVLVSACPCALSIITPMTVKIAKKKASDLGVVLKDSKALETAANVTDIIFDLNGTLTEGEHKVTSFNVEEAYIPHLELIERDSQHHVGAAIHKKANQEKSSTRELKEGDSIHHNNPSGLTADIDGVFFIVGNRDIMQRCGIDTFPKPFDNPENGHIYFAYFDTSTFENKVIGQIKVEDEIRKDAIHTIDALKKRNIRPWIATGDSEDSAKRVAKQVGIELKYVHTNSSAPGNSKASLTKLLQRRGYVVANVGDSQNDSPAMAAANLGIAVKSPTAHLETQRLASIVINNKGLFPIAQTFEIAAKSKKTILFNLSISLSYNIAITLIAAGVFIALGVTLNPVIGVALMIVESAIVMCILLAFKASKVETKLPNDKVRMFKDNQGANDEIDNTLLAENTSSDELKEVYS